VSDPVLSVAIQAHPARADLAAGLAAKLAAACPVTVWDPDPGGDPSAWRTYRAALERTPVGVSHRLVVQEDAEPCPGFVAAVGRAVRARPDRLLCFFHGGQPRENVRRIFAAARRGEAWAVLDPARWVPTVALFWPAGLVTEALAYVDAQSWPGRFRADDEIVGRFVRALDVRVLASVPSLVEHPDLVPSLLGRRAAGGRNPDRVACCWIGECDAASIDWETGPE
jgi:hypothetical protein